MIAVDKSRTGARASSRYYRNEVCEPLEPCELAVERRYRLQNATTGATTKSLQTSYFPQPPAGVIPADL
jgi:hypothetical protein